MGIMNVKKNAPTVFQLLTRQGRLYAIILLLSGCTTGLGGSFCEIYEPVYPDYKHDTAETIRQIDRNNVVYMECCRD